MMASIKKILGLPTRLATACVFYVLTKIIKRSVIKKELYDYLATLFSTEITIEGKVTWLFLPYPGLKITTIQTINHQKPSHTIRLFIDCLTLYLKIKPLLRGKWVVGGLRIEGLDLTYPDIHLPYNARFSSLSSLHSKKIKFALDYFFLSHGKINLSRSKYQLRFHHLQIQSHFLSSLNAIPIELSTTFDALLGSYHLKAATNYKGHLSFLSSVQPSLASLLTNLELEGEITFKHIVFNTMSIPKINGKLVLKENALNLTSLFSSLYGGYVQGYLYYQWPLSKLIMEHSATQIDTEFMLRELGLAPLITGRLDATIKATLDLNPSGSPVSPQGTGELILKNGCLNCIDLSLAFEPLINKLETMFKIQMAPFSTSLALSSAQNGKTPFQSLHIHYRIVNQTFIHDSIVLQTEPFQLEGKGCIDLTHLSLNHVFNMTIIENNAPLFKTVGIPLVPLRIEGSLTHPMITFELMDFPTQLFQNTAFSSTALPFIKNSFKLLLNKPIK